MTNPEVTRPDPRPVDADNTTRIDGRGEVAMYQPFSTRDKPGDEEKLYRFDNGYGASVVRNKASYGGRDGLWELSVTSWDEKRWEHVRVPEISHDVIGWLDEKGVDDVLAMIEALPGGAR